MIQDSAALAEKIERFKPSVQACIQAKNRQSNGGTEIPGDTVYLDPPYYDAGPELYPMAFKRQDHERLREHLRGRSSWVLRRYLLLTDDKKITTHVD